jgi:hypothetical protein
VSRIADRGAITAAYVGIGMAVTIGVSFLLVIPIEAVVWLLALPSGLMIGYYANARSDRRAGPWRRIISNALFAGAVTGLTAALLLLGTKALFFYADNGFRDPGLGGPIACTPGPDCVYQRYLDDGRGPELATVGVTDADTFTGFYWNEQLGTAGMVLVLTVVGSLFGGGLYGAFRPKPTEANPGAATGEAARPT